MKVYITEIKTVEGTNTVEIKAIVSKRPKAEIGENSCGSKEEVARERERRASNDRQEKAVNSLRLGLCELKSQRR